MLALLLGRRRRASVHIFGSLICVFTYLARGMKGTHRMAPHPCCLLASYCRCRGTSLRFVPDCCETHLCLDLRVTEMVWSAWVGNCNWGMQWNFECRIVELTKLGVSNSSCWFRMCKLCLGALIRHPWETWSRLCLGRSVQLLAGLLSLPCPGLLLSSGLPVRRLNFKLILFGALNITYSDILLLLPWSSWKLI